MAEVMHTLVTEAKKNRFSAIPKLTEEDVVNVWDTVSKYIEKQMALHKGVNIPGLGTFTFTQKKLEVGNNKYILIQRPVFIVSEKFAMTHALSFAKHHTTGQIPIVQLNFAALSNDTLFDRDTVESCVKEVLQALARSIQSKRNVEFNFSGIGRLSIRESKVKMKFFKDFLRSMDGSGNLVQALSNRPGTADSVLSETFLTPRPHTSNTLILPRIQPGIDVQQKAGKESMPPITEQEELEDEDEEEDEEEDDEKPDEETQEDVVQREQIPKVELLLGEIEQQQDEEGAQTCSAKMTPPVSAPARAQLQTSKASGVSISEQPSPKKIPLSPRKGFRTQSRGPKPTTAPSDVGGNQREFEEGSRTQMQPPRVHTPPGIEVSGCKHGERGGQELCYLCHQRAQRNIPVYLAEERYKKEMEEDRLLQQYQQQKDAETILREQGKNLDNRKYCQKIAAFNLGVAEAIKTKKNARPTEFCRSYVFQNRPLTPPRAAIQEMYSKDLGQQVRTKQQKLSKLKKEQEFLDRLEQVQLAEDLAIQRESYLRDKKIASDLYKKALDTQIDIRTMIEKSVPNPVKPVLAHLRLPKPRILPFASGIPPLKPVPMIRFKPLPIPALEPDSLGPIFGVYDTTDEKLEEKNRRARKLYLDQLDMVAQKKRQAILNDLKNQKEESEMLERTRRDIILDRALRHQERLETRKNLEESWAENAALKKHRESDEKQRAMSPGMLIHEQCEKYRRCKQCGRKGTNCGESNVWSESRYIPGSRLMV